MASLVFFGLRVLGRLFFVNFLEDACNLTLEKLGQLLFHAFVKIVLRSELLGQGFSCVSFIDHNALCAATSEIHVHIEHGLSVLSVRFKGTAFFVRSNNSEIFLSQFVARGLNIAWRCLFRLFNTSVFFFLLLLGIIVCLGRIVIYLLTGLQMRVPRSDLRSFFSERTLKLGWL